MDTIVTDVIAVLKTGSPDAYRAHTAVTANQRYRFTTWRFGKVVAVLLLVGLALKVGTAWR